MANAIRFDDINQYYCNFDDFEVTQKSEFREQIKQTLQDAKMLMNNI